VTESTWRLCRHFLEDTDLNLSPTHLEGEVVGYWVKDIKKNIKNAISKLLKCHIYVVTFKSSGS